MHSQALTDALVLAARPAASRASSSACPHRGLRAIFAWIALSIRCDEACGPEAPADVLASRRACSAGFARLLAAMAARAGLEAAVVAGVSKARSHQVWDEAFSDRSRHAWNKVELEPGRWYFLDACLASGASKVAAGEALPDGCWLAPAQRFVTTHLPDDPADQLLAPPWSLPEFARFPKLTGAFFAARLDLRMARSVRIACGPEVRIVLTAAREDAELRAQLTKLPEPLPAPGEDAEGAVLERRAVVQRRGPALNVRARPPEPGAFELRIFAREGAGFQLAASYLLQAKLDGPPLDEFDEAAA